MLSIVGTSGNDTLRLFHQKNGALTTLITSHIKTKNTPLAVELVRSPEALWTLRVGSSFAAMSEQGAATYDEAPAGSYVGFSLIYSNANQTKEMWVDEVYARFVPRVLAVPRYGDIVFSELMVHPTADGELPEEYIELYNRTDRDVSLDGWTIASPTRVGRITAGAVKAHGYALVGRRMAALGDTLAVTSRPTLTDGGMSLRLADARDVAVAALTYSDRWYGDEAKQAGGYALEKVDVNNLEETAANWQASNDERGGTPHTLNSVAAANPDNTPPSCLSFEVAGSQVRLNFSEAIDGEALSAGSFAIDKGLGAAQDVLFSSQSPASLTLRFAQPLAPGAIYTLAVEAAAVCDLSQNCSGDFTLPVGLSEAPAPADIAINEVLFNPFAGGVDFVELYNRSEKIVALQGLQIANRKASGALNKAYRLPAYPLFPRSYVVLTTSPEAVQAHYACPHPLAFIALATMPSYPNDAGCVALLDSAGAAMEDFYYTEKMHSGILADRKGVSLERINPDRPAAEASNWLSAAQAAGFATPTGENSQHSERVNTSPDAVSLFPEVFSPDGDGFDDVLFVAYAMPTEGYIANITVFDAAGRVARTLCRSITLAVKGQLSWDGTCDNGAIAPIGLYVVMVEAFSLEGKVSRYKKTCVVGARF